VALLLPAVQQAREASRRTACTNNLKQLALGVHNHHDTYKFLPNGGEHWSFAPDFDATGAPQVNEPQRAGWGYQILPFIEQTNVWDGKNKATVAERQIQAMGAVIPAMFCPTRRVGVALPPTGSWYGPGGNYAHGPTDYAGSSSDRPGAIVHNAPNKRDNIAFSHILDGTSNVMLVGEKRMDKQNLNNYQSDDNEGYSSGWDHDVVRRTQIEPRPDTNNGSGWGEERFGGSHPGGFQAAACDGSVRFISYTIDLATFQRYGERADGNAIELP
jgi:hypothetical protein